LNKTDTAIKQCKNNKREIKMKLVKTASGKKQIKISKSEWENIGKTAGWMKQAQSEVDHEKLLQEIRIEKQNKEQAKYKKAPISECCGTCQYATTDHGLYTCGKHGFNVSLSYICNDYQKDPSKQPLER
jgi:hypothetical protein